MHAETMKIIDYDPLANPIVAIIVLVFGLVNFFIERDTVGVADRYRLWGLAGRSPETAALARGAARFVLVSGYLNVLWHFVRQILVLAGF